MDVNQGFKLDHLSRVPEMGLVLHLMELGYLHNQIKSLCKDLESKGTAAKGLIAGINSELTNYYKVIADFETKLQTHKFRNEDSPMSEENFHNSPPITLRRLLVWGRDAMHHLQILCDICKNCLNKRGGMLISAVYTFFHHGDPFVQETVIKILSGVSMPLFKLICYWVIHGDLYDPMDEFFIIQDITCSEYNKWRNKYMLREKLIPAIMSYKQAEMVLNAGKCINFLNEICSKKIEINDARARLQILEDSGSGDLLTLADPTSELSQIIELAFLQASKLVLDVLKSEFKLYENFQALRRYMLMGQGDFFSYFLQLLEPELCKPATLLYKHNLISIMETAMRSTNAQFEDEDIANRLSVKLLEPSEGETGWDVFYLDYNVDGPLDTVFQLSQGAYRHIFLFLWKLKRLEYILSSTWREQTSFLKKLSRMNTEFRELQMVLTQSSLLTSEMVHYVHQVQSYILSEVMECTFENFVQKFKTATSIEEVINEHDKFLQEIRTRAFLCNDDRSKTFGSELRIINNLILDLRNVSVNFLSTAEVEFSRRVDYEILVEQEGTNFRSEAAHKAKKEEFSNNLLKVKAKLRLLSEGYQVGFKIIIIAVDPPFRFTINFSKRFNYTFIFI
uniref:Uncharacterized protein n=1 Tax=Clastoptera arizonana TaxID=38151 RepID=A0A1B6DS09_9HEMI